MLWQAIGFSSSAVFLEAAGLVALILLQASSLSQSLRNLTPRLLLCFAERIGIVFHSLLKTAVSLSVNVSMNFALISLIMTFEIR